METDQPGSAIAHFRKGSKTARILQLVSGKKSVSSREITDEIGPTNITQLAKEINRKLIGERVVCWMPPGANGFQWCLIPEAANDPDYLHSQFDEALDAILDGRHG